jgi:hypothetical protein
MFCPIQIGRTWPKAGRTNSRTNCQQNRIAISPIVVLRKYARVEGVTLPPSEDLCPGRGSNSPTVGARNLTQFGEKGKNASETWLDLERKEGMNLTART